jgi:hypothetical protein
MESLLSKKFVFGYFFLFIIFIFGCAFDVVHVKQIPAHLNVQSAIGSWKLVDDIEFSFGAGYIRKLKKESKWDYVGSIESGDVYKTDDQILTVEASNIYEAYIVISGHNLVGFYLPVEKTYSPLSSPIKLQIEVINP